MVTAASAANPAIERRRQICVKAAQLGARAREQARVRSIHPVCGSRRAVVLRNVSTEIQLPNNNNILEVREKLAASAPRSSYASVLASRASRLGHHCCHSAAASRPLPRGANEPYLQQSTFQQQRKRSDAAPPVTSTAWQTPRRRQNSPCRKYATPAQRVDSGSWPRRTCRKRCMSCAT